MSLLIKKKLQPQELNSQPRGRSQIFKNPQYPAAPCCTILQVEISATYISSTFPSLPHDAQIDHRQKPMIDLGVNKQLFSSSTTTTTILHDAYPPSRHHHPHFVATTVTIANGRHSHPSPTPITTTTSITSQLNETDRREGGVGFAGATSPRAMWQPNDE